MKDMSHREMIHAVEILAAAGAVLFTAIMIDVANVLRQIRDAVRGQR